MTNADRPYEAFYRGKCISVTASTSLAARDKAASIFKARKAFDVTVVLADVVHSGAELPGA